MELEYQNGYGYESEGEPSDEQIRLQDVVDNAIADAVNTIMEEYREAAKVDIPEYEHDIGKITEIRELIEKLYNMPEVY